MVTSNVLFGLLNKYLQGELLTTDFCQRFEHAYNFEADLSSLPDEHRRAFSDLFDVVAWYVPDFEERKLIQNYKDDKQVLDAAQSAAADLLKKKGPGSFS